MNAENVTNRMLAGGVAGIAATAALQPIRSATAKRFPSTTPPIRQEPGEFMVDQLERALPERVRTVVPQRLENVAARWLALGYGITFGALFAAIRKRPGNVLVDGAALGVATWAAGYLGWLPATGLMPPVTRQRPRQVVTPMLQHVVFGVIAAAVIRRALSRG